MVLSFKKKLEFELKYLYLIGNEIKIINSSNPNQIGISGIIVKESSNFIFIKIKSKNNIIAINKNNLLIQIRYDNLEIELNCSILLGSIQQRLKKLK